MELALFFYLAGIVENVTRVIAAISCMTFIVFAAYSVFGAMHYDNSARADWGTYKKTRKYLFKWCIGGAVGLFILSFIPSKSTMYTMAAAYGTQKVAENPDVKRLAGKSLDVLEKAMDNYIKDGAKKP